MKRLSIQTHRTQVVLALVILGTLYFLIGWFLLLSRSTPFLTQGKDDLTTGVSVLLSNPSEASARFTAAADQFNQAANSLRNAPLGTTLLTPLPPFRWEVRLTKAALYLSNAGTIADTLSRSYPHHTGQSLDINALLSQTSGDFFGWYATNQGAWDALQTDIANTDDQLSGVPSWILLGHEAELASLQEKIHSLNTDIPEFRQGVSAVTQILGTNDPNPHTIALLFQNDAELRPTGGFIGSYGSLVASGGVIRQFKFGEDIYKLDPLFDGQDGPAYPATEILKTLTTFESLRDSNVGFGFLSQASPHIQSMFATATGSTPEAIIFIDSTLLEDLLRITGPITLPGIDGPVTADTVNTDLTEEVERIYFQSDPSHKVEQEPKSIIGSLIPLLLSKLEHSPNALSQLLPDVMNAIDRKSLQFWSSNQALETVLASSQPTDTPTDGNWIKIVNTNLGGLKSSRYVHEDIAFTQQEDISNHRLVMHLTVTRNHTGTDVWPDGSNRNYVEIYLPPSAEVSDLPTNAGGESTLPDATQKQNGIFDKTWTASVTSSDQWQKVGVWETVAPGGTLQYTLTYTLPLNDANEFHLEVLKQAGSQNQSVSAFGITKPLTSNLSFAR